MERLGPQFKSLGILLTQKSCEQIPREAATLFYKAESGYFIHPLPIGAASLRVRR